MDIFSPLLNSILVIEFNVTFERLVRAVTGFPVRHTLAVRRTLHHIKFESFIFSWAKLGTKASGTSGSKLWYRFLPWLAELRSHVAGRVS
eukprot:scaffold2541_cov262-Pinguiococcus_pyrenoidosus.AAC.4